MFQERREGNVISSCERASVREAMSDEPLSIELAFGSGLARWTGTFW